MSQPPYRGERFPASPRQPSGHRTSYGPDRYGPDGHGSAGPARGSYGSYGPQGAPGTSYGGAAGQGSPGAGSAAYGPPQRPQGGHEGYGGHGRSGYGGQSWGPAPQPYGGDPRDDSGHGSGGHYYAEGHTAAELPLAPIHRRALARLMDAGMVWAFGFALVFPIAVGAIGVDGGAKGGDDGGGWTTVSLVTTFVVMAVLPFFYEAIQLAAWGHTVGKRVMALSVVRVQPAGDPLPVTQAVWRAAINNIGYQLAIFFFLLVGVTIFKYALILMVLVAVGVLIAYLWAIFDQPLHQAIHDRFAGTVVVDDRLEAEAETEAGYQADAGY